MGWEAWLTLGLVGAAVALMALEWLEPPYALGITLGLLVVAGAVRPQHALAGFSSPSVATVACILVLSSSLERSRLIRWFAQHLAGAPAGRSTLARIVFPVAGLSAFMANTAIVGVFIPAIRTWARHHHAAPSKYLIPLSYAGILGGACTLIGTSTNLVVDSMLREAGHPGFEMFTLLPAGLPVAVVGLIFLVVAGYRLLPDRTVPMDEVSRDPREYVARLRVEDDGPLDGSRLAALRRLDGMYVAGVEREHLLESPVGPDAQLHAGDVLVLVGDLKRLAGVAATNGLSPVAASTGDDAPLETEGSHLVEAVISPSSPLVGKTFRDSGFRGRYDAVIFAVHRHGGHIMERIGDIVAHPGDTLLLLAGSDFLSTFSQSRDFYLVSEAGRVEDDLRARDWLIPVLLAGVVLVASLGLLSLLQAAIAGVVLLVLVRRVSARELWGAVHWSALFTIACAIGIGHALQATGVASGFADFLVARTSAWGAIGAVLGLFCATMILTEFVTNVAAAALMIPIGLGVASGGGWDPMPMAIAIALGASMSFATPFGYHTNAMVAGAGAYRFRDFLRAGVPMKLVSLAAGTAAIAWFWGL